MAPSTRQRNTRSTSAREAASPYPTSTPSYISATTLTIPSENDIISQEPQNTLRTRRTAKKFEIVTPEQREALVKWAEEHRGYPSPDEVAFMARRINKSVESMSTWINNWRNPKDKTKTPRCVLEYRAAKAASKAKSGSRQQSIKLRLPGRESSSSTRSYSVLSSEPSGSGSSMAPSSPEATRPASLSSPASTTVHDLSQSILPDIPPQYEQFKSNLTLEERAAISILAAMFKQAREINARAPEISTSLKPPTTKHISTGSLRSGSL